MSEVDARYFVLPMVFIFIFGIAALNTTFFPVVNFLLVMLIALFAGLIVGFSYLLIKKISRFLSQLHARRNEKKVVESNYHKA